MTANMPSAHHHHQSSPLLTPQLRDFGDGILAIDSGYGRDEFDAIHLLVEKGRVAVIDTATRYSVPRILQALAALGLSGESVDYVALTHVHLDHAGGAGELLHHCPNAQLTVHPRGARHMVDPSKLWAAVVQVYGEEMAVREYGGLDPIAADRIIETPEGTTINLNGRVLEFWDSPGHAKHHVFIRDSRTGSIFTGDTFGISYRELDSAQGPYVFITSSPSQFDPPAHQASVRRVMNSEAPAVYLTHYSQLRTVRESGEFLLGQIDRYAAIAQRHGHLGDGRAAAIEADLQAMLFAEIRSRGVTHDDQTLRAILDLDLRLNADGLVCWLDGLKG